LIVPPKTKGMPINVFCVEHGRWGGRADTENALVTGSLARHDRRVEHLARVAKSAKEGKFPISAGNLGKGGRLAVQEGKGQGEVWQEVGKLNRQYGAENMNSSGAFTANYVQGEVVGKVKPFLKEFDQPIATTERVVGVIVAV